MDVLVKSLRTERERESERGRGRWREGGNIQGRRGYITEGQGSFRAKIT